MKSLFFVLTAAVMMMLSACGKEAAVNNNQVDTTTQKTNLLVGTWYYTTDTTRYYTSGALDSTKTADYFQTDNILFNANLTGIETRAGVSNDFKYSVSGQNLVFSFNNIIQQNIKVQTNGLRTDVSSGTRVVAQVKQISATDLTLVFGSTIGSQTVDETAHFTNKQ